MSAGLVILDRDGVLNVTRWNALEGAWESPLGPQEVALVPGAADAVALLCRAGFTVAIASNQPSAAKGKTTREALEQAHARVLELLAAGGGLVASSHLCFHRAEDGCRCRKPAPGLLLDALAAHGAAPGAAWMAGDRATDVEAGRAAGVRTALVSPMDGADEALQKKGLWPDLRCADVLAFARVVATGVW